MAKKIRVINITEEGRQGGPQKRIAEVAVNLKNKYEIETIVICPQKDSEKFRKSLLNNKLEFYALPLHKLTSQVSYLINYVLFFFYEIFMLYRKFKELKPDIVHCNGSWQIKGIIASKIAGIPSIWHMNDTATPSTIRKIFPFIKNNFGHSYAAASRRSAKYYFPDEYKSITLLPAPISTNIFSPDNIKPSKSISSISGIKIVNVGNVNYIKGHEVLLEAANIINKKTNLEINFFIIGGLLDSQKSHIKKLLEKKEEYKLENFHFLGYSDEIGEILQAADIYVCSSHFESSPISVWEALSMQLPVISTNVGDIEEIFNEYNCGIVIPTNNAGVMADKIIELIEDKEKTNILAKKARQTAIEVFDIDACCKRYKTLYESFVNKASNLVV